MSKKPSKQEILREGLDEIRAENRLVEQRRIERESDTIQTRMSLPEGRGPFFTNREDLRAVRKHLRLTNRGKRRMEILDRKSVV